MYLSSGKFQPKDLFKSLIVTDPSTIRDPSGWDLTPSTSMSVSSSISPTISSRISSNVTMPLKSPYSLTTIAKCSFLPLKISNWSNIGVVSGAK